MKPYNEPIGDNVISHGGVFGEAVDDSSEWVGIEEAHGSVSHLPQHGVVERVAEMKKYCAN